MGRTQNLRQTWGKYFAIWKKKNHRLTLRTGEQGSGGRKFSDTLLRKGTKIKKRIRELGFEIWKRLRHQSLLIFRMIAVLIMCAGLIEIAVQLYQFVYTSRSFSIREIIFSSTKYLSSEKLKASTKIYLGQNIFQVNLRQLQRNIALIPEVERVHVRRQLPNLLVIDILEYEPAVAVDLEELYLSDKRGVLYQHLSNNGNLEFPIVTGLHRSWYQAHVSQGQLLIRHAIELLQLYNPSKNGRPPLREIRLIFKNEETLEDFVLETESGVEIWLEATTLQKMQLALIRFDTVWAEAKRKQKQPGVILINNRAHPDWVVVRN